MANIFKPKRGNGVPGSTSLEEGELGVSLDRKQIYIGAGLGLPPILLSGSEGSGGSDTQIFSVEPDEGETDLAAITRITIGYTLNIGDMTIVVRQGADGKSFNTTYVYDGSWKVLGGGYNSNTPVDMSKDFLEGGFDTVEDWAFQRNNDDSAFLIPDGYYYIDSTSQDDLSGTVMINTLAYARICTYKYSDDEAAYERLSRSYGDSSDYFISYNMGFDTFEGPDESNRLLPYYLDEPSNRYLKTKSQNGKAYTTWSQITADEITQNGTALSKFLPLVVSKAEYMGMAQAGTLDTDQIYFIKAEDG